MMETIFGIKGLFGLGITPCFYVDDDVEGPETGGGEVKISKEVLDVQKKFDDLLKENHQSNYDDDDEEEEKPKRKRFDEDIEVEDDEKEEETDEENEDTGDEDSADEDNADEEEDTGEEEDSETSSAISPDLKARAKRLGFEDSEIKAFKNPDTLKKILDSLEGQSGEMKTKDEGQASQKPKNPFKYESILDDTWDDDLKKDLTQRDEHNAMLFMNIIDELISIRNELNTSRFDAQIASLGPEYESIFGKGRREDLDPKSKEYRNRQRLDTAINALQSGRQKLGKEPLPFKAAFEQALHGEFYKELEKIKGDKIKKKLSHQSRRMLLRPGSKGNKPITGLEAAYEVSRSFDRLLSEE